MTEISKLKLYRGQEEKKNETLHNQTQFGKLVLKLWSLYSCFKNWWKWSNSFANTTRICSIPSGDYISALHHSNSFGFAYQ